MKLNSNLIKSRHGVYYLRCQRFGIDKRISLRTKDQKIATIEAYKFGLILANNMTFPDLSKIKTWSLTQDKDGIKIETDGTKLDHENAMEALKLALSMSAPSSRNDHDSAATSPRSIRDAINEYKQSLTSQKIADKSKKMALSTLEDLACLLGGDFDCDDLNDTVIEDRWLPHRLSKVKSNTAKRDLSFIKAFVDWCADKRRMYSPARLTFSISKSRDSHWEYFTGDDLKRLFDNLPKPPQKIWQYWIPLIGLFTGARVGEIASLKTSYFFEKSGIHVMHLEGTKTDTSPRDLPVHSDLIKLGLLDLVNERQSNNKEYLFDLPYSKQNGWGAAPSKWFSTYRVERGVLGHKSFHSFRHTIIDLMNQASVDHKAQCQYTGHSEGGSVHRKVYGRGLLSLQVIKSEVVDKIDFRQYCGWSLIE